MGKMPGKLCFRWNGPYWLVAAENGTFTLGTLTREILPQKVNGFRLKPYAGATRLELWEEAEKQQQWFEEHLTSNANLAKQGEQILKDQIAGMEERHMKEVQLWADMKLQYEARAQGQASKIKTLKLSLDEMRVKRDMGTERIRTLLHTQRDRFEK